MTARKKANPPKGAEKKPAPANSALKEGKYGQAARLERTAGVEAGAAETVFPARPRTQLECFEAAVRLFHARKFREARELFLEATQGANRGISHKAELHVRMCDRRLEEPAVVLHTSEEHYDYAVALINSRRLDAARQHLEAALAQAPDADHIYYALALCQSLSGDLQGAYENLKRAIDLQPRNRIAARQDADFAAIAHRPPLDRLLYPDKKNSL